MFKRYRVFVLALGLVTAALSGQAQEQNEEAQGTATEEQNQPQILPLPLPVEIIESDAAADARQRSENEAKEREIRDLAAQEGVNVATQAMNDATQRMADYAYWTTFIVGVGTVLLFWTLWETRKANQSAREAVTVTRDVGQAQIRAYLDMSENGLALNPISGPSYAMLTFKNSGHTPAYQVFLACRIYVGHIDDSGHIPNADENKINSYVIGPNSKTEVKIPIETPIDSRTLVKIRRHEQVVHIVGNLRYVDIFGQSRISKFHLFASGFEHGKVTLYAFHPEGNQCT